ncbi:MAG: amidohydrolase family protein, partial [Candidatus Kapabacteria bacterium]|nr:amidohydrolase family protein [Candidatus Kapabacteria bacterium]
KGSSKTPYPSALMGSIALIRQTFLDAQWYGAAHSQQGQSRQPEFNSSYEALANDLQAKRMFLFETENEHSILRAYQIAKEFSLNAVYEGNGYEYRRLPSLVVFKPMLILPLNFPAVPDVSTTERALDVALDDLKHWDAAPENPMRCDSAGLQFCLTTHGLKNKDDFWKNLRKAVERGLKQDVALASMTTQPAKMLGLQNKYGSIKQGNYANLLLSDGNIFEGDAQIRSVFIAGDEYIYSKMPDNDVRGVWSLSIDNGKRLRMDIDGKAESPNGSIKSDTITLQAQFTFSGNTVSFRFTGDTLGFKGVVRLSGSIDSLQAGGTVLFPDGRRAYWSARRDSAYSEKKTDDKKDKPAKQVVRALTMTTPNTAFGVTELPKQQSVVLKNATVWTCNKAGDVLQETDVFIKNGKIAAVGKNLSGGDVIIDVKGKHVTPGIIDEHSHIAIEQGVNEGTHAITAEVRIGDVVFP